jgi:hypothetical protein
MIYRFNLAQLTRDQRESLVNVLEPQGLSEKADVSAVEFPEKLRVIDGDKNLLITWQAEYKSYVVASGQESPVENESLNGKSVTLNSEPEPETPAAKLAAEAEIQKQASAAPMPTPASVADYNPVQNCVDSFNALEVAQQKDFLRQIWDIKGQRG